MSNDETLSRITLSQVDPELRQQTGRVPNLPVSSALGRWMLRTLTQLFIRDKQYEGVRIEKRRINNSINLRVYTPDTKRNGAALLWIHGGGLVIGTASQDDRFCAQTARELGMVIVSTDYRLAPDFPFPAALDDCLAAWTWLQACASELGIDTKRVAIGGQSAGGGLAASLVQRIHDDGGVQPVAQWLFCPMLDDRTAARRELDSVRHFIWNNDNNRTGWQAYLGKEPGSADVPEYAVPARRVDLSDLPPAWIGVSDIELFFEENKSYAERLQAAAVACSLDIVSAAPHGFESFAHKTKLAQDYLARSRAWLQQHTYAREEAQHGTA